MEAPMNAAALNDNAVTDAAERMHLPTLAGGDAEEEEDTAQSDWALPGKLLAADEGAKRRAGLAAGGDACGAAGVSQLEGGA